VGVVWIKEGFLTVSPLKCCSCLCLLLCLFRESDKYFFGGWA